MRIEFDEEQKSWNDPCPEECEWYINGTCTCKGILPCLDYDLFEVKKNEDSN
jgi:hypothetical protein